MSRALVSSLFMLDPVARCWRALYFWMLVIGTNRGAGVRAEEVGTGERLDEFFVPGVSEGVVEWLLRVCTTVLKPSPPAIR